MTLSIKHIDSKFKNKNNPKVGLIALSTDQTIEGDFNTICKNLDLIRTGVLTLAGNLLFG